MLQFDNTWSCCKLPKDILPEPLITKVGCLFKVVRGPHRPRPKIVDRGALYGKEIANGNKHVAILLYLVLFRIAQKILAGHLIVKVLQSFEVVRGPHRPRISILGLSETSLVPNRISRLCKNFEKLHCPYLVYEVYDSIIT